MDMQVAVTVTAGAGIRPARVKSGRYDMSNTTSLRRLGVVLAALAIAGLGVGCVPETPSGEPPNDPCATPTASSTATANVTSKCPAPCPTTSGSARANVTSTCPTPCPTTAGSTPAIVGGTCPTTPTLPPQPCDAATQSGGDGVTTTAHSLGVAGPTSFLLEFNALNQPDRFQVLYEGVEIYDSGWRGGAGSWNGPDGNPITIEGPGLGSATVAVPAGAATAVTVVVTGQGPGTIWDYTVNCPTPPV